MGSDKYLPIGSVVLLNGGEKKIMITGFCSVAVEDETKIYDYTGCVYPEGYLDFSHICLFNHEQISKIYFEGYRDEEEVEFKKLLIEMMNEDDTSDEEDSDVDEEIEKDFIIPNLDEEDDDEEDDEVDDTEIEHL